MNYQKADEYLGRKLDRPIGTGRATRLVRHSGVTGDSIHLKLHDTYVVTWYADGRIELNSGGWRTVTTKARINEYVNSGYGVSQEKGQWYLGKNSGPPEYWKVLGMFEDGLIIHPDGRLEGVSPIEEATKAIALRRKVNTYAKRYAEAFGRGEVAAPGLGDCFYCVMVTAEGKTLGEATKDHDHILSHIEENYFVPSLLRRAMEETPTSIAFKQTVAAHWMNQPDKAFFKRDYDWFLSQMKSAIKKYFNRQLGQAA